jgi:hypothetical protein
MLTISLHKASDSKSYVSEADYNECHVKNIPNLNGKKIGPE